MKQLGFDPLFFDPLNDAIFDGDVNTGLFARQHTDRTRSWSVYLRDLILTNNVYHRVYDGIITTPDQKILMLGFQALIEIGVLNYKNGESHPISEQDIINVFTRLGGGAMYTLGDGRPVLGTAENPGWWDAGRPETRVGADTSFDERLSYFNQRIEFLADNGPDVEAFLGEYYSTYGSTYYPEALAQIENYLWIAEHSQHLHYLVHLEDIEDIASIFAVEFPI